MNLMRLCPAIVLTVALAPAVLATDRFFPDAFAVSPNGRFRIDAKSPANAGQRMAAFAANFTYTLTDATTQAVIWERKQPMTRGKGEKYAYAAEGSPMGVFVHDDGSVAVYTSSESLVLLDAADGHKRGEAPILKSFPAEQHDQFVSVTTAGPMWTQGSEWFFLEPPDGAPARRATDSRPLYFVIRPYWDHRLIIDAKTGKLVDLGPFHDAASTDEVAAAADELRRLLTATIEEESRRAMATLSRAPAEPAELVNAQRYERYRRIRASLRAVEFLKLAQAEPSLRAMETFAAERPACRECFRAEVRQALRSIGETPAPGFGVLLFPLVDRGIFGSPDLEHQYNAQVPVEERVTNAGAVVAGMSMKTLTDLLGYPDAECYDGGHCYDYDIDDANGSYTLRILLERTGESVETVKKITPFAFLHDVARRRGD